MKLKANRSNHLHNLNTPARKNCFQFTPEQKKLFSTYRHFIIKHIKYKNFCKKTLSNSIFTQLYNNEYFEKLENTGKIYCSIDLSIDTFMIVPSSNYLSSRYVDTGFAICSKGSNYIESYISLCYVNKNANLNKILLGLKNEFLTKGCEENSIEFYILGGTIITDYIDDYSIKTVKKIKKLIQKHNIKGIRFNNSFCKNKYFHVLLTANKICYSTNEFFNPRSREEDYSRSISTLKTKYEENDVSSYLNL